jgi:hypothetical protein
MSDDRLERALADFWEWAHLTPESERCQWLLDWEQRIRALFAERWTDDDMFWFAAEILHWVRTGEDDDSVDRLAMKLLSERKKAKAG